MTHAIEFKQPQPSGIRHFRKFVFINDSSLKSAPNLTRQLHQTPNSNLLSQAQVGSWLTINHIYAPQPIISQLENLQFKPEERVQLVSKTRKSSVVVDIKGKLIAIGAEIAQKIVVNIVDETKL